MQAPYQASFLKSAVSYSFLTEVNVLKPGNVHCFADGHGMTRDAFLLSAELVTPILCDPNLTVGMRILNSVQLTKDRVRTNTNLGMLLLFAPLIRAAELVDTCSITALQHKLQDVLTSLNKSEARLLFQAIRMANPGGLGQSAKYDVNSEPDCSVLGAMEVARERDSIARQYAGGYHDIFKTGHKTIKEFTQRWNSVEWAAVVCYLTFLSELPDSHIVRKYGPEIAEQTRRKAIIIAELMKKEDNPDNAVSALLEFDRELKNSSINPGTSADLTAASILVYSLVKS
jgi:Triphosphoribosyl-dephospho-CoA synthetase